MKKRIFSILIALTLVFSSVLYVSAETAPETSSVETLSVSVSEADTDIIEIFEDNGVNIEADDYFVANYIDGGTENGTVTSLSLVQETGNIVEVSNLSSIDTDNNETIVPASVNTLAPFQKNFEFLDYCNNRIDIVMTAKFYRDNVNGIGLIYRPISFSAAYAVNSGYTINITDFTARFITAGALYSYPALDLLDNDFSYPLTVELSNTVTSGSDYANMTDVIAPTQYAGHGLIVAFECYYNGTYDSSSAEFA